MAAEMHDRGLQLTQLAQEVERLGRPPGLKVEAIAKAAALELVVDRARFAIER